MLAEFGGRWPATSPCRLCRCRRRLCVWIYISVCRFIFLKNEPASPAVQVSSNIVQPISMVQPDLAVSRILSSPSLFIRYRDHRAYTVRCVIYIYSFPTTTSRTQECAFVGGRTPTRWQVPQITGNLPMFYCFTLYPHPTTLIHPAATCAPSVPYLS